MQSDAIVSDDTEWENSNVVYLISLSQEDS